MRAVRRGRRAASDIFSRENAMQLTLFFMGALVVFSLFSQYIPVVGTRITRGPNCLRRPNPPGGNQRSLLASIDESQTLELEVFINNSIDPNENVIREGHPLELQIVFHNRDTSPLYLYLDEERVVITPNTESVQGATLPINPVLNPQQYMTESLASRIPPPPGNNFDLENIYIIEGQRSCNIRVTIEGVRLQQLGIVSGGEFELAARYHNNQPGVLQPVTSRPTATPMFLTMGVWTGDIESDDVRFSVIN